jgi:hypothetical protein
VSDLERAIRGRPPLHRIDAPGLREIDELGDVVRVFGYTPWMSFLQPAWACPKRVSLPASAT